jgi:hypothetical protein
MTHRMQWPCASADKRGSSDPTLSNVAVRSAGREAQLQLHLGATSSSSPRADDRHVTVSGNKVLGILSLAKS